MSSSSKTPDSVKIAADHLRAQIAERNPFARSVRVSIDSLKPSHARALVAGALGYKSPQALAAAGQSGEIDLQSQWLGRQGLDLATLADVAQRMGSNNPSPQDIPQLAAWIADGLTPACAETGIQSIRNMPVGDVSPDDGGEVEWVHPSAIGEGHDFAFCPCCGQSRVFRVDDLDDQGLCSEHRGEFDLSPEEREDLESLAENLSNRWD